MTIRSRNEPAHEQLGLAVLAAALCAVASCAAAQDLQGPQFGAHAYPAQDTILQKTSFCGVMEVRVSVNQHWGSDAKPRTMTIALDGKSMSSEEIDRVLQASSRLASINQIGVNCVEGRAVDITLYGADPAADKVRILLRGARLFRID